MIYENEDQLKKGCESILACEDSDVRVLDESRFREKLIDDLIHTTVFSSNPAIQESAAFLIRRGAANLAIVPASIRKKMPLRRTGVLPTAPKAACEDTIARSRG